MIYTFFFSNVFLKVNRFIFRRSSINRSEYLPDGDRIDQKIFNEKLYFTTRYDFSNQTWFTIFDVAKEFTLPRTGKGTGIISSLDKIRLTELVKREEFVYEKCIKDLVRGARSPWPITASALLGVYQPNVMGFKI